MDGLTVMCRAGFIQRTLRNNGLGILLLSLPALFLLCFSSSAQAASEHILVLSQGKAAVYSEVVSALRANLEGRCPWGDACTTTDYSLSYRSDGEDLSIPPGTSLIVTLGVKAAHMAEELNTDAPIIHALISRASSTLLEYTQRGHTAIYLDQPLSRQLRLVSLVRKTPRPGILLGPASSAYQRELQAEADRQGINVIYRKLSHEDHLGSRLKALLEQSNILLALPDPLIFNRKTIFNILLSSYHNKIPVVGFSAAYVKAGALIAAYSSPADIARHLGDIAREYRERGKQALPEVVYPKYFSIAINHSVARSLGISLPEETEIVRRINQESSR